jgi:hypothetical protein
MAWLSDAGIKEMGISRLRSRNARVISWEPFGRHGVVGLPNRGINFYSTSSNTARTKKFHCPPGYFFNAPFKQAFSSALNSLISMPAITMNLQASSSRGLFSSGSLQVTRQYWQSWFQQKRP